MVRDTGEQHDEAEDQRLPVGKLVGIVPHSEDREQDGERERRACEAVDDGAAHRGIVVAEKLAEGHARKRRNLHHFVLERA